MDFFIKSALRVRELINSLELNLQGYLKFYTVSKSHKTMYAPLLYVWTFPVSAGVCLEVNDSLSFIKLNSHRFALRDIHPVEIGQVLTPVGYRGN